MASVLGVVLVTYNGSDVILDCLETLFAAAMCDQVNLRVALVDNASHDGTVELVRDWAAGRTAYIPPTDLPFETKAAPKPISSQSLAIIEADVNGGFAAGVNLGLKLLFSEETIERVWILNPDCVVPIGTPGSFLRFDPGPFSLMGGRAIYFERPDIIQIDGGTLNRWTGVTGNLNLYKPASRVPLPPANQLDFVTGASMVVSRHHYENAGPMPEDYFLYYEEVDWAMNLGGLPLAVCPDAIVYHRGGSSIGSPVLGRPGSPFSLYFKHRARIRFVRRHCRNRLLTAWIYTFAKVTQYAVMGWIEEARAVLDGAMDTPLPRAIQERLGPEGSKRASLKH
jgi:GT2 family glycosyltransferase